MKSFFRFYQHPGGFFRNTEKHPIPDPEKDLESFLVNFLRDYQSDDRVAYLDDLYKFCFNEFESEEQQSAFMDQHDIHSLEAAQIEIQNVENRLKSEAYSNFYHLILKSQIEIIT